MKYILILILLFPLVSAINITADYPDSVANNEEIKFNICIIDSAQNYDLKIDISQDNKRISKILNDEVWTSSMYYLKDAITDCSKFYIKIDGGSRGNAEVIIKLRDSKNKIYTFYNYSIKITQEKINAEENKKDSKEIYKEEVPINATKIKENIIPKTIILSPKAFNSTLNSKSSYTGYVKYSFVLFCLIITILYITKPKEKENEFRY